MRKSESKTYNFLSENKSIEDIKNQPNIVFKEKKRHGGSTFKLIEKKNVNMQQLSDDLLEGNEENLAVASTSLVDSDDIEKTNTDILTKLKNHLSLLKDCFVLIGKEKLQLQIKTLQIKIENLERENAELKKEVENLKQNAINLTEYTYNCITIYDEKQSKKNGIAKIYEEILAIEDKIMLITTFVHSNQKITEEIIYFYEYDNEIEVIKQLKHYESITKYKDDCSLIAQTPNHEKNIKIEPIPIKKFLIKQHNVKAMPTKCERILWWIFTVAALLGIVLPVVIAFPTVAIVPAFTLEIKVFCGFMAGSRIFSSLFLSATKRVDSWYRNKIYKSKEEKEQDKKMRSWIIKNLASDKFKTKLETQYEILKQELDNRKNKKFNKLINKTKNYDANNNVQENFETRPLNNNSFDSSIRTSVNNEDQMSNQTPPINNEAQITMLKAHM